MSERRSVNKSITSIVKEIDVLRKKTCTTSEGSRDFAIAMLSALAVHIASTFSGEPEQIDFMIGLLKKNIQELRS